MYAHEESLDVYGQSGDRQIKRPGVGVSHVESKGWGGMASAATPGSMGEVRGIRMVSGAFSVMYEPFRSVGNGCILNAVYDWN